MAVEVDPLDVIDLIHELRDEPNPYVRVGLYTAAVILGLVADDPDD